LEITVSELERLSPDSYILYDTRSEQEKLYGVMEGAVSVSADKLLAAPPEDKTQKLMCKRKIQRRYRRTIIGNGL